MKYRVEHIAGGQEEVIIRCSEITKEVEELLRYLRTPRERLLGMKDGQRVVIDPAAILYIESVDGRTFVYTTGDVLQVEHTLQQLEQLLTSANFFRCSKAMILNINKVKSLKSLASNRIDATMQSGEHILISRTYASEFRKRLKGGNRNEEAPVERY